MTWRPRPQPGCQPAACIVADVDQVAVDVADPEAAIRRPARRVHLADARAPQGLARRDVLLPRRAEGEVVEALLRAAVEEDRRPLERRWLETHRVVPARRVHQPEIRVELLAGALVGHLERVVEQRLDRHLATSWRTLPRLTPSAAASYDRTLHREENAMAIKVLEL